MRIEIQISKNLTLFFILGFSSVGVFSAFTYNALIHTQVINASLFNTAIPAMIILVCFMLKIEKTNIFQNDLKGKTFFSCIFAPQLFVCD